MERITFLLRALPDGREAADAFLKENAARFRSVCAAREIGNFSMWAAEDMYFGYGEAPSAEAGEAAFRQMRDAAWDGLFETLCVPGDMRLMYHDIGIVREDKSLIRHRVFCTHLKPGCAEEYKRRHDGLIAARGDTVSEGPDSDFTIWYGAGYIFGYCEKVKAFDHDMTDAEKQDTIAWETRQLEIMDWLTDDTDWITGDHHEPIRRLI